MSRPRCRAPVATISHSHPPASPTPPMQARGLTRAGFPIGPTRGRGIVVGDIYHRRMVTRGGDKCWRRRRHRGRRRSGRCRCCLFLLRPRGHNRVAWWLTSCRRPWRPQRTPPRRHKRSRPERLGGREGGHDRRHPVNEKNTRMSTSPSKSRAHRGSVAHLKLEKPRFLFLEGSGGATVAPTSAVVALAGSSTDNPVAGASAPTTGTNSTATSAARGDGGDSTSRGGGAPCCGESLSFRTRTMREDKSSRTKTKTQDERLPKAL
jgi:hypothetical protein